PTRATSTGRPPSLSPTTPATAAISRSAISSPPALSPAPLKLPPAVSSNSPATVRVPSRCPQAKSVPSSPTVTRLSFAVPVTPPAIPASASENAAPLSSLHTASQSQSHRNILYPVSLHRTDAAS